MMSPRTLLGLPAYLYGVGCMFWCVKQASHRCLTCGVSGRPVNAACARRVPTSSSRCAPASVFACRCFQLGCLTGFIKWWQFSPARNDIVAA